jgi:hypothetical protein
MQITNLFSETLKHSGSPNSSRHLHKLTRNSRASSKVRQRRKRHKCHNNLSSLHRHSRSDNLKARREAWDRSLQFQIQ